MSTNNVVLMQKSREALKGKWALAIGTGVIYLLLTTVPNSVTFIGPIAVLIITGPLAMGMAIFSLAISRNQEAKVEQLFQGFNYFGNTLEAYLRILLYVLIFLLLLIVPGIIVGLSYSMTFYILADNPVMKAREAMEKSKRMMDGNKLKLFYLGLRFFGLALLCILTLGIGFLWLFPYMHVTMAKFYDDIINK